MLITIRPQRLKKECKLTFVEGKKEEKADDDPKDQSSRGSM